MESLGQCDFFIPSNRDILHLSNPTVNRPTEKSKHNFKIGNLQNFVTFCVCARGSAGSSGDRGCTEMPLSQCSSNENLATELSQFTPPRFTSNEVTISCLMFS